MNKCCGTCKFDSYDFYPNGYYCENKKSERFGLAVTTDYMCNEWTEHDNEQK